MDRQTAEDSGYYEEDYQDYEGFEDIEDDIEDEDVEALAEDDPDDDEAFDAEDDDDDDEGVEAFLEDDDDDDEAIFEVENYDDDEGVEDDDDDDEALAEDYDVIGEDDESVAAERRSRRRARSRLNARRARRRARLMNIRARAARRRAAIQAKRARRTLNKRLKKIRGRGRVSAPRISKARGTGFVTAILANGRRTKMMFKPALATRTDVNRLTRQISVNAAKQARAISVQGKNITRLKSAQSAAVKSLTAQQLKSSKLLTKQITNGDKSLDKRITKLVSGQKKSGRKQDVKMLGQIKQQQSRSTWNTVLVASAIPLFAAYGDRAVGNNANPLTKKNLIIAGSTAAWLFVDDVVDRFLTRGSKKWRTGANIWNIAAPFANAATVYYFMKDKQHERFVTGVETVKFDGNEQPFDFINHVGEDSQSDLGKIQNPVVVATIQSQTSGCRALGVEARIDQGKLKLKLISPLFNSDGEDFSGFDDTESAEVAWKLDTLDPGDQRS